MLLQEFSRPAARSFRFVVVPKSIDDEANGDLRNEDLEFSVYEAKTSIFRPLSGNRCCWYCQRGPLCDENCRGYARFAGTT